MTLRKYILVFLIAIFFINPLSSCTKNSLDFNSKENINSNELEEKDEKFNLDEPTVLLSNNAKISGVKEKGTNNYRGIPYAKQPVGNLRFAPPKYELIKGNFNAKEFGSICPSLKSSKNYNVSEACLNLNIQTPIGCKKGDNLPVYIYMHGGWFQYGNANMYDGTSFVKNNIIYVGINYRLNIFGFLSSEEMRKKYGTSGNLGILDQITALEWVYKNIESFGGNKNNITIGGESAGAFSSSILLTTPLKIAPFKRVILESGSVYSLPELSVGTGSLLSNANKRCEKYFEALDLRNTSLRALRKISTEKLLSKLVLPSFFSANTLFLPVRDNYVIPYSFKNLKQRKVDILFINNGDEARSFIPKKLSKAEFKKIIYTLTLDKTITAKILSRYDSTSLYKQRDCVATLVFLKAQSLLSDKANQIGAKSFVINFDYVDQSDKNESYFNSYPRSAKHTDEIKYVFNKLDSRYSSVGKFIAKKLSKTVCDFIKGVKSLKIDNLKLKAYSSKNPLALIISSNKKKYFSISKTLQLNDINFISKIMSESY